MKRAIYPGSFDPITVGHIDILERSLSVFDEITIVVASSSRKTSLLQPDERVELVKDVFKGKRRVKVDRWDGLIMDYARERGSHAVIRGLRAASDFEYEFMMAAMNKRLNPDVETFFMMTGQNYFFISSSMIKELFRYGGDISPYVPPLVWKRLKEKRKAGDL
ncbi:MAG: pantetheine-phosphate adenylyltransferase [Deltaproteobacteria bacterium]|nr:pantetheine-phosphate adenylyltransferase [Deltaproteobacteria bacterium]